ncbi:Prokaryotic ATPase [Mariniradius saccharolyticus AK6]|uniref:Prokaryotic ATPase n=1 Tax=Mariniradius saccharolyticus AK6 TaxID=1239962 RepID=M7XHD0_9BACT|nr:ATP-binding protein [Mariniradius saccharolyticus]EMS34249.1 Prokaryotic ATPase [Mariniradius saccharolyticus AK6]
MERQPIPRLLEAKIQGRLFGKKAILVFGPRQVGKTTLCMEILRKTDLPYTIFYGDDADIREAFAQANGTMLRNLIGDQKIILIDEAQRIPNIGLCLKIIVDQLPDVQVIATGSSSFDLANLSNEPLTGRKYEFFLYPLSFSEMVKHHGFLEEKRHLEHRMLYGYYPEIVTHANQEKELLNLLAGSYLYKDLLMLEGIKKPLILEKLLKALAMQLGSEVNYNELGQIVGADKNTVEKYIDLLEKAFVIFRVPAFNRNVRSELKKGKKIYFYDCGIRNAILKNFNPLSSRLDVGALWENFFLVERMKFLAANNQDAEFYFWRTTAQQEIDFIEESEGNIKAFECKWNPKTKTFFPSTFRDAYPYAALKVVNSGNFEEFTLNR